MQKMFEELAQHFAKQEQPRHRDHCWVLAADAALRASNSSDADLLRLVLLKANPHHLLRPFANMADAMNSSDVQEYVSDLREQWPAEQVETMWRQLGLDKRPSVTTNTPMNTPAMPFSEEPPKSEILRPQPKKSVPPAIAKALMSMESAKSERAIPPMPMMHDRPKSSPHPIPSPPAVSPELDAPSATLPSEDHRNATLERGLATFVFFLGLLTAGGIFFLALVWPMIRNP